MSDRYHPTEHDGLKKDGTPDQRVKGHESEAHRENAAHNLNNQGGNQQDEGQTHTQSRGQEQGGEGEGHRFRPTEHDGLKKDGTPDQRVKGHESDAHKQNAAHNLNNQ
ncbi:uncharacterized protein EV422DRAFT_571712 [Fimicolochytrium jonesii]|uniref:uncharacterized protein n=1 Tax=Fimicolochytrium jonesii TaxID=1396493 RepID=UPI0022FDD3F7|nr:uncharacterized protein EV422DRAFT_571712 [Fimicolochytrium jonesii]KAI8816542.1 hypothetical protein EV422DRAFT_571712 [Fimicolochytrium jonesii]